MNPTNSKLRPSQVDFRLIQTYPTNQSALDFGLVIGSIYRQLDGTIKVVIP